MKQKLLGIGAFGKVFVAESKEKEPVQFAIKVIHVKNLSDVLKEQLAEEVEALCLIDHPFVVKYIESFRDEKYIYIVM